MAKKIRTKRQRIGARIYWGFALVWAVSVSGGMYWLADRPGHDISETDFLNVGIILGVYWTAIIAATVDFLAPHKATMRAFVVKQYRKVINE